MGDLDDVEGELRNLTAEVTAIKDKIGGSWWWAVLVWGFIIFSPSITFTKLNKAWYSAVRDVSYDKVEVAKKPTGCDWGHAPIGDKGCSYKKAVQTTTCGTDNKLGKSIVSYDGGKTWNWWDYDGGSKCVPAVYIQWNKQEDE